MRYYEERGNQIYKLEDMDKKRKQYQSYLHLKL